MIIHSFETSHYLALCNVKCHLKKQVHVIWTVTPLAPNDEVFAMSVTLYTAMVSIFYCNLENSNGGV